MFLTGCWKSLQRWWHFLVNHIFQLHIHCILY